MRGKQHRDEPLFSMIRLEDLVPKDHILRKIDELIDFSRIEPLTRELYSSKGRPSIDPEVLIRMMVVGYLYGILSERKLCEEVQLNLAYRWFCGLSLEDRVPHHSTFSKNRHGRFAGNSVFRELFEEIVKQAAGHGLIGGKHLSVDATTVAANASMGSLEPILVQMDGEEYLEKLEEQNGVEEASAEEQGPGGSSKPCRKNATHRSRTDPDARIFRGRKGPARLSYSHNVLMDNAHAVIVDVELTRPQYAEEGRAAVKMLRRSRFSFGLEPETIGADKAYATGETLRGIIESGVTPHVPDAGRRSYRQEGIFPISAFSYQADEDAMICPAGKRLRRSYDQPEKARSQYSARVGDCRDCPLKVRCTRGKQRVVNRHWDAPYIQQARAFRQQPEYRLSMKRRQQVERLFGEAKEQMGLRRAQRRRYAQVQEQMLMTGIVQNIKRIVAGLSSGPAGPAQRALTTETLRAPLELLTTCWRWIARQDQPIPQILPAR